MPIVFCLKIKLFTFDVSRKGPCNFINTSRRRALENTSFSSQKWYNVCKSLILNYKEKSVVMSPNIRRFKKKKRVVLPHCWYKTGISSCTHFFDVFNVFHLLTCFPWQAIRCFYNDKREYNLWSITKYKILRYLSYSSYRIWANFIEKVSNNTSWKWNRHIHT